ncbi:MAG: ACT domain-containing protein [Oscillospiraceae bacterium]|nr:ACT domain-containing protein [Oscillospiraceae bacterium]
MANNPKYYIVEASALPEVFLKVAEAKRLLSTGEASTVNDATRMTDISRSAFYKYRDAVLPFQNMMTGRIITFQLLLQDEPGILSSLLTSFADRRANIITINSIVPTNGCAVVTISAETMDLTITLEDLLRELRQTRGVIKAEILAG